MSIELSNAPALGYMNGVFREYLNSFVVVHIDDILIYFSSLAEHQRHVTLVLEKLRAGQTGSADGPGEGGNYPKLAPVLCCEGS